MATTYTPATDAARIANDLIRKHHTRLADVRIEFVFRDTAAKNRGRAAYGKTRKMSGLNAFMSRSITCDLDFDETDDFFVVELAHDVWTALSAAQKKAVVDHHLCELGVEYDETKDEWKLALLAPDVVAFTAEIERHGFWDDDLLKFRDAVKEQLGLFAEDA